MSKLWRILAIDGGGIRGLIPATILSHIEERTGKPIAEQFDLIAGTSTGGILALGLTKPDQSGRPQMAARDMIDIYERDAPKIFHKPQSWWGNLLRPKYVASKGINRVMTDNLGDTRLKDAVTNVLIPCYDIERRAPHLFKSHWARWHERHDFAMSEVACAASATPTMFEPAHLARATADERVVLVDGGVFANNPSLLAFAEIKRMLAGQDDEFLVVSLGTGQSMKRMQRKRLRDWGFVHWSTPMIELVSESGSEAVHEQMRHLLPQTDCQGYYRFQVALPDDVYYALDNPSKENMAGLIAAADQFLADPHANEQLSGLCRLLMASEEQQAVERRELITNYSCAAAAVEPNAEIAGSVSKSESRRSKETSRPGKDDTDIDSRSRFKSKSRSKFGFRLRFDFNFRVRARNIGLSANVAVEPRLRMEDCKVLLCYDADDLGVVRPLADALAVRGILPSFERLGSKPRENIRRLLGRAKEHSLICVVVLSPALLKNSDASKPLAWLYSRKMKGRNLILPVIHNLGPNHMPSLVCHLHRMTMPATDLKSLFDLCSERTTAPGTGALAEQLIGDMNLWLEAQDRGLEMAPNGQQLARFRSLPATV